MYITNAIDIIGFIEEDKDLFTIHICKRSISYTYL